MKSATKLALVIGGTGVVLTAGSLNAFATWTSAAATSTLEVATAELPRGETPTVSVDGADVLVRWKHSVLSDGKPVRSYVVTRKGAGNLVAVCGRVTATSCTDRNVAEGTWTWQVRPMAGDWEGKDSADSEPLVVLSAKNAATTSAPAAPTTTARQTIEEAPTAVAEPPTAAAEPSSGAPNSTTRPLTPVEAEDVEPAPPTTGPADEDKK